MLSAKEEFKKIRTDVSNTKHYLGFGSFATEIHNIEN